MATDWCGKFTTFVPSKFIQYFGQYTIPTTSPTDVFVYVDTTTTLHQQFLQRFGTDPPALQTFVAKPTMVPVEPGVFYLRGLFPTQCNKPKFVIPYIYALNYGRWVVRCLSPIEVRRCFDFPDLFLRHCHMSQLYDFIPKTVPLKVIHDLGSRI